MNRKYLVLTLTACSLLPLGGLRGQVASPSPSPQPSLAPLTNTPGVASEGKGMRHGGGKRRELLAALSPEERQKLVQARRSVMADPAVQAARADGDKRGMYKAAREAMLKEDPSVAPILAKMRAKGAQPAGAGQAPPFGQADPAKHPGGRGKLGGDGLAGKIAFLPEDERAKLRDAYTAANADPEVTPLRQQWVAAGTPETKIQAAKTYRDAMRNSMLRSDPSIAPVLEKVRVHAAAEAAADPTSM